MAINMISDEIARHHADNFLRLLDQAMASDFLSPATLVLNAMDALYEILTTTETNTGYAVQNHPSNGDQIDIMHGVTKEFWDATLYDDELRTQNNISFWDLETSRMTFLITLGSQVLINLPQTREEVRLHVKREVANVFNHRNYYQAQFVLIFIDYNLIDGEYAQTNELGQMLIV